MTRKPLLATDRVSIVLTLVPYLVERESVSVVEAAADFGLTPDEMRKMVTGLVVVGLPNGMDNELFDIDWDLLDEQDELRLTNTVAFERAPRFTAREAAALLAGLQLAQAVPGVLEQGVVPGLIAKLSRGASETPGELLVSADPIDDVRATVSAALGRGVALSFTYKAPDAPATTRTVDPVRVLVSDAQWYLRGWCHLREAMRTFHLERVTDLVVTDIVAAPHDDPDTSVFSGEGGPIEVQVRFANHLAPMLGQYLDRADVEIGESESTTVLRVADPAHLKRLAARRGGGLVIESPAAAREAAATWAAAGLEQYR